MHIKDVGLQFVSAIEKVTSCDIWWWRWSWMPSIYPPSTPKHPPQSDLAQSVGGAVTNEYRSIVLFITFCTRGLNDWLQLWGLICCREPLVRSRGLSARATVRGSIRQRRQLAPCFLMPVDALAHADWAVYDPLARENARREDCGVIGGETVFWLLRWTNTNAMRCVATCNSVSIY